MPNYYEILQVTPSASDAEILAAYEAQYNQWRRLVTHHDPTVVNQANQALQALETIRETLSESARRRAYDAGIGLDRAVGGLADPAALLQSLQRPSAPAPMTPPAPPPQSPPVAVAASVPGLWACAKCGTDNPSQTKFCFKCGTQLVRACPECHKETSLISTGMCGECGYSYERAVQRQELRQQIATLQQQIGPKQEAQAQEIKAGNGSSAVKWGVILLITGLGCAAGGSNTLAAGLILLIFGGLILFFSYNSSRQHKSSASNLADQIQQMQAKQLQLQSELDTMPNR